MGTSMDAMEMGSSVIYDVPPLRHFARRAGSHEAPLRDVDMFSYPE
jgi:hypothetical protein